MNLVQRNCDGAMHSIDCAAIEQLYRSNQVWVDRRRRRSKVGQRYGDTYRRWCRKKIAAISGPDSSRPGPLLRIEGRRKARPDNAGFGFTAAVAMGRSALECRANASEEIGPLTPCGAWARTVGVIRLASGKLPKMEMFLGDARIRDCAVPDDMLPRSPSNMRLSCASISTPL
jgi:hypothetical protein